MKETRRLRHAEKTPMSVFCFEQLPIFWFLCGLIFWEFGDLFYSPVPLCGTVTTLDCQDTFMKKSLRNLKYQFNFLIYGSETLADANLPYHLAALTVLPSSQWSRKLIQICKGILTVESKDQATSSNFAAFGN